MRIALVSEIAVGVVAGLFLYHRIVDPLLRWLMEGPVGFPLWPNNFRPVHDAITNTAFAHPLVGQDELSETWMNKANLILLVCVAFLMGAGASLLVRRKPVHRFEVISPDRIGQALDTATGQECWTLPKSVPKGNFGPLPYCEDLK